ncbi:hypothetical protein C8J95_11158 [Elizabethkingia sp. YR214]|uniref:hypothetical protein n=1 Tax=Elizabethkingia sp. YR214 TaxID=2135667 RepID=UPI000D325E10|nr:hypothetical protein [Elizabethkingia sp. YR214]PUB26374.1 hypothetical protein C8J95_11158 [Elizabethkingia sp. YR214]
MSGVKMLNLKGFTMIFVVFLFFSCEPSSQDKYLKSFDIPLLEQNNKIRLSGDYRDFTVLNTKYYKEAQKKKYEDGKALCYINLSFINSASGNSKQALFLLEKAKEILKQSNNKLHIALLNHGYADLNFFLQLYNSALNYNTLALQAIEEVDNDKIKEEYLSEFYIQRGEILFEATNYKEALKNFHKAEKIKKQAYTEGWLTNVYIQVNKLDSAFYYLKQSHQSMLKEKEIIHSTTGAVVYFFSGNYYNVVQNYPEAETLYLKALKINSEVKTVYSPFFDMVMYDIMADMYKKAGDKERESHYKSLYRDTNEHFYKQQKEVVNLATEKFITDIQNSERAERRKMWLFIGFLVAGVVGLVVFTYIKIRHLKFKKQVLHIKTNKLKEQIENNLFNEVIELAKTNDSMFLSRFQELYPEFIQKLKSLSPELETSEMTFCAMIKLNFTSKEIANYTFVQHASVQQRKRRIRKKFAIPSDADLYQFFSGL